MKASIGRIVHYVAHGTPTRADGTQAFPSACRAAVITEVSHQDDEVVGLCVLNPTGLFFHPLGAGGCPYADPEEMQGGSWHWPKRVD